MSETIVKIILETSLTAGIAAIVVMLLRIPMKRFPKRWSYMLWAVVFFRCLCPFSVESAVSLLNAVPKQNILSETYDSEYDTSEINLIGEYYSHAPIHYEDSVYVDFSENADFNKTDSFEKSDTENTQNSVDVNNIIFAVWIAGPSTMALYAVISYVLLIRKVRAAVKTPDGVYETDLISTAFTAGFFSQKIYVPYGLSKKERELIIAHEQVHIKRFDYIANPLAFIGLTIHWFNPLIWIAYAFMTKDMELSCDETVLEMLGSKEKISYSETLLRVSMKRSGLVLPLAFAKTGIKGRVKNVLEYKKPKIISTVLAAIVVITACAALGTNALENSNNINNDSVFSEIENDAATEINKNDIGFSIENMNYETNFDNLHFIWGINSDDVSLLTYENNRLVVPIKVSNYEKSFSIGILAYVDGIIQPYSSDISSEKKYMQSVEVLEKSELTYEIYIDDIEIPEGKAEHELSILSVINPDYTPVQNELMNDNHTSAGLWSLRFNLKSQPEKKNFRISSDYESHAFTDEEVARFWINEKGSTTKFFLCPADSDSNPDWRYSVSDNGVQEMKLYACSVNSGSCDYRISIYKNNERIPFNNGSDYLDITCEDNYIAIADINLYNITENDFVYCVAVPFHENKEAKKSFTIAFWNKNYIPNNKSNNLYKSVDPEDLGIDPTEYWNKIYGG